MKIMNPILDDPVVREVRAARAKLWRAGGGTVAGFMKIVKEIARGKRAGKSQMSPMEPKKRGQGRKRQQKAKRSKGLPS